MLVFGRKGTPLIDAARYVARNAETRSIINFIDKYGNVRPERSVETGTV